MAAVNEVKIDALGRNSAQGPSETPVFDQANKPNSEVPRGLLILLYEGTSSTKIALRNPTS